jgi:hypothetical protein
MRIPFHGIYFDLTATLKARPSLDNISESGEGGKRSGFDSNHAERATISG